MSTKVRLRMGHHYSHVPDFKRDDQTKEVLELITAGILRHKTTIYDKVMCIINNKNQN